MFPAGERFWLLVCQFSTRNHLDGSIFSKTCTYLSALMMAFQQLPVSQALICLHTSQMQELNTDCKTDCLSCLSPENTASMFAKMNLNFRFQLTTDQLSTLVYFSWALTEFTYLHDRAFSCICGWHGKLCLHSIPTFLDMEVVCFGDVICRINQKPDKGEPSIGTLFYFKAKGEKSTNSKFNHSLDSMIQVLYEDDNMTRHTLNFTSLIWITFLCVRVLLHHLMLIDFQTLTWITVGKCTFMVYKVQA